MPDLKPRDRVTIGQGKKVWIIVEFWHGNKGERLASLYPEDGYSRTTVEAHRLKRVY